ncbi:MAG: cadherin repeat domain-containing protein [Prosthecobacter sp.]|uniref:cadherin repeat domain-containing protein n=1 Tax=Prosthecobacter sp. TaxID=1965333 RepID=UPI003900A3E5
MKTRLLSSLLLLTATAAVGQGPQVYFAIAVHSEEPGGGTTVPNTPNFTTTNQVTYVQWRDAILAFAQLCAERGLAWQFQSDWNFLEGVQRFEMPSGSAYDPLLTANTAGKNVVKYLHENLNVNLDPHSHEGSGRNYADVAYLLDVVLDTEPTGVVGGHVYTGTGYQQWPKFVEDPAGLLCARYSSTGYRWKPVLLMGGGTASHRDDPHASGLWHPSWDAGTTNATAAQYFTDLPGGPIAAIGNWEQDLNACDQLLRQLESGTVPHAGGRWTMGHVFNHRDMVQPGYLTNIMPAQLDTIKRWRDAGRITVAKYADIHATWSGTSSLYRRPEDNVGFSLNWQDLSRPELSAAELRTLLNHHEAAGVPVDVFFTTWQTDLIEALAPEMIGRLQSSSRVTMGYHVRAPKPYASIYPATNWFTTLNGRAINAADIENYETHGLDLAAGLPTTSAGGFLKLANLMGYAPRIVGANASTTTSSLVHSYFNNAGAGMLVEHRSTAINLGDTRNGMYLRPESFDWILIEHFRGDAGATSTLTQALANAHSAGSVTAPYFVGIKLHDNDLFAEESAWTHIYVPANRPRPYDPTSMAALLSGEEMSLRRTFYLNLVTEVAGKQDELNVVSVRDALSLLAEEEARPVGLSFTEVAENQPVGSVLAEISGGGTLSGIACDYTFDGGTDDADFMISGSELQAARVLDYETGRVKSLRVRWTDGGGNTGTRALTLVLSNVTTDDDDGDGMTEADETVAGTDPQSSTSRLAVSGTQLAGNQVTLTWASVPGISYQIQSSSDLITWNNVSGTQVTATAGSTARTLTAMPGARQFYRVSVGVP